MISTPACHPSFPNPSTLTKPFLPIKKHKNHIITHSPNPPAMTLLPMPLPRHAVNRTASIVPPTSIASSSASSSKGKSPNYSSPSNTVHQVICSSPKPHHQKMSPEPQDNRCGKNTPESNRPNRSGVPSSWRRCLVFCWSCWSSAQNDTAVITTMISCTTHIRSNIMRRCILILFLVSSALLLTLPWCIQRASPSLGTPLTALWSTHLGNRTSHS